MKTPTPTTEHGGGARRFSSIDEFAAAYLSGNSGDSRDEEARIADSKRLGVQAGDAFLSKLKAGRV